MKMRCEFVIFLILFILLPFLSLQVFCYNLLLAFIGSHAKRNIQIGIYLRKKKKNLYFHWVLCKIHFQFFMEDLCS